MNEYLLTTFCNLKMENKNNQKDLMKIPSRPSKVSDTSMKIEQNMNETQVKLSEYLGANTMFEEEILEVGHSLIPTLNTCPYKREEDGGKFLNKSTSLIKILNHFYHFHIGRVNIDGKGFLCTVFCHVVQNSSFSIMIW